MRRVLTFSSQELMGQSKQNLEISIYRVERQGICKYHIPQPNHKGMWGQKV